MEKTLQELEKFGVTTPISIQEVFDSFLYDIQGKKRKAIRELVTVKNKMIHELVHHSLEDHGKFVIPAIDGSCQKCHGTGRLYKLSLKPGFEPCPVCKEGVFSVECRVCDATGRYIRIYGRKSTNQPCKACNGTGLYGKPCFRCGAKGKVPVMLYTGIQTYTNCPDCKEFGFPELVPKPQVFNGVQGIEKLQMEVPA
jgi:hypothetical protein